MKKCVSCDNIFIQKTKQNIYCSRKCRSKSKYAMLSEDKKKLYVLKKKKRLHKMKKKLVSLKGGSCNYCGYNKCMSALEFHHIYNDKEIQISKLKGYRLEKILKELDKCILLCSNCHSKEHNFTQINDNYRSQLRLFLLEISGKKCSDCGEDNINSLDFHHNNPNEKKFEISKAISHRWDINKIVPELKKCNLFCRNCHREHHIGIKKIFKKIQISEKDLNNFIQTHAPKRICRMCHKTFKGFSQKLQLCSQSCENKYYNKGYISGYYLDCHSCSKVFNTKESPTKIKNCVDCRKRSHLGEEKNKLKEKKPKKIKHIFINCFYCHKKIIKKNKKSKYCSRKCFSESQKKVSNEELKRVYLNKNYNVSATAKSFNMSANAVKKRLIQNFSDEWKYWEEEKYNRTYCKICKSYFESSNKRKKYCSNKCKIKVGLLRKINFDQVLSVLNKNNFNVLKSSKDLEIPRTTLRDFIKKHKIKK